ncbi:MAG: translocation/assembly module TamB domain-containing protein [Phocaeicola sp.]|uniref:translocation/assembly module TamB domain-containing protein n=1 Tax=Phocaeicola sp. TaxID=2773926 RepID=UPI003F9EEA94
MTVSKGIKYSIYIPVGLVIGLYLGIIVLLNIPFVQSKIAFAVTGALKEKLHTELSIGKVDMGLLNRIIIEDVTMNDRQNKQMLNVTRLSAKFDILPLLKKKISISSVQFFGFTANFNKNTPTDNPNFQFVLDAFASKDTVKKDFKLDLRVNSVLIRRGRVIYDVLSEPSTPNKFDKNHIGVTNFAATISLKTLTKDTLNASIRRISFDEQSGFSLKKAAAKVTANNNKLLINNFKIELSNSDLSIDTLICQYNKAENLFKLSDDVTYKGKLAASVSPTDMAPIVPTLFALKTRFDVHFEFEGKGHDLTTPLLEINNSNGIVIAGNGTVHDWQAGKKTRIEGRLKQVEVDSSGIDFIGNTFLGGVKAVMQRVHHIQLNGMVNGYLSNLNIITNIRSGIGDVSGEGRITLGEKNKLNYSGNIKSTNLNIGKLIGDENLGEADFDLDLTGFNHQNRYPETTVKGVINSLVYSNYKYENIILDGNLKDGGFNGNLTMNDPNGTIELNGKFNRLQAVPTYNITTSVRNLRLKELHLSDKYADKAFSFNIAANFTGHSIDDLIGTISLDSLTLSSSDSTEYQLSNLTITSNKINDTDKELHINSPFLKATVRGDYSYKTLPASILHTIQRYIPSLLTLKKDAKVPHNNFDFTLNINDATFFKQIFRLPLELHYPATLSGSINDNEEKIRVEGHFPEFQYNKTLFDSGNLICENSQDQFLCNLRTGMLLKTGGMLNVAVEAKAKNDNLKTIINWGNNTHATYVGKLASTTHFSKTEGKHPLLNALIDIEPTHVVMNDTIWNIHPSQVEVDSGKIYVSNFLFEHDDQYIKINGKLTKNMKDSCLVDLKDIDLSYILSMTNFDLLTFGGGVTGKVNVKGALGKDMDMNTNLSVHNFLLNNSPLGDAKIHGLWDNEKGGFHFLVNMQEPNISKTRVDGMLSLKNEEIDLKIYADSTNIAFLHPFVEGIFSQLTGRANGYIHLFGPLSFIDIEGDLRANANGFVKVLNTGFTIPNDSVHLYSGNTGNIIFKNVHLKDPEGHDGIANGVIHHHKLTDLSYNFDIRGTNMLMYNTQGTDDMPFYGRIYATGNVSLNGGNNALNINAKVTTARNSEFTYVTGITTEATDNQFITFIDKTPRRIQDSIQTHLYHPSDVKETKEDDGPPMDLRMNLLIDANNDATIRVIMDPIAGDFISATGNGNLQVNYFNKGDMKIFGSYIINQGIYKLSMQEVIRKDFALQQGGTVNFSGDPYHANVDVQAVYTIPAVSLNDLGIGDLNSSQSSIKVNCLMNLTGNLSDPEIHFDLELPTVSEEDRELVKSITATEEQMNTQIIYLLGIGKFYTYDYAANTTASQGNATSSLALSTISSQLNNMISQWMTNKNWNIGANFSSGQEGWSDMEAQAILSGRLLNNRLLINGNFGYRDNALANTNFVGDFEARWLLTKNGEWQLKGYNQTNNRYFVKSTLTTQGVGIIYKRDLDNWLDMFKIFRRKKRKEEMRNQRNNVTPVLVSKQKRDTSQMIYFNEERNR